MNDYLSEASMAGGASLFSKSSHVYPSPKPGYLVFVICGTGRQPTAHEELVLFGFFADQFTVSMGTAGCVLLGPYVLA